MRILILAPDVPSGPQFGPNIRMRAFARALSPQFDVTLAYRSSDETARPVASEGKHRVETWNRATVAELLPQFDIVVSNGLQYPARLALRERPIQVFDLYDPVLFEQLASPPNTHGTSPADMFHLARLTRFLLARGDYFLCASPQQRDLWLGGLYSSGRVTEQGQDSGELMERLIGIVPFGCETDPPQATRRVLKGIVPGISESDRVLLWGGGIWNWFDPETVIAAVDRISKTRADIKLFFMSSRHPDAEFSASDKMKSAHALAQQLGALNRSVFFHDSWVDFDDRVNYLLESDLAVCTAPDSLENHFSFRTRLVDAVWAGIPIVCTRGGYLADFVEEQEIGRTVPAGQIDELAAAIIAALEPGSHARFKANCSAARQHFAWQRCTQPLVDFCLDVESGRFQPRPYSTLGTWRDYLEYKLPALAEKFFA